MSETTENRVKRLRTTGDPQELGDWLINVFVPLTKLDKGIAARLIRCGELLNGEAPWVYDSESEEQRTNDLKDLVLQLVERVEKLEQRVSAVVSHVEFQLDSGQEKTIEIMDRIGRLEFAVQELERPYYEKPKSRIPTERELNKADRELRAASESGHHIARALEKMSDSR